MAARETPAETIERLLRAGDNVGALRACDELLAKAPNSFVARLGRARAFTELGRGIEAERELDAALRLSPRDEHANLLRASVDAERGRADDATARLRPIASGRGPHAVGASVVLFDILYNSNKREEMRDLVQAGVKSGAAWTKDQRAPLHIARALVVDDPAAGAAALGAIARDLRLHPLLRRITGFEAAGLLDKAGQFREAFETAKFTHATTSRDFDIDAFLRPMQEQLARFESGENWIKPAVDKVQGVALIVAMPRSGTTLLEQMLDRHPAISGIGEFEGVKEFCLDLESTGAWPRRPASVPQQAYAAAQKLYLEGAHRIRRDGASWTFDKSLRVWRSLPEIAAVLPGAVCIDVHRDPRDMATSCFLSYFHTSTLAWAHSLASMRRVIEMQRSLVPRGMEVLGIPHETVVYEDLVEDPAGHAERCLKLMGLAMDERVLAPEGNTRASFTLSALQVRKPINRSSIGRWKNYEFAFDASWDKLVDAHEAMRARTARPAV